MNKEFLLILAFLLLFSCKEKSSHESKEINGLINQDQSEKVDFQNRWILQKMGDTSFTEEQILNHVSVPRFKVDTTEHHIFGNLGCNGFSAKFEKDGNKIHFTDLFNNEIACPSLSLENDFRKLLLGSDSMQVMENRLILYSDSLEARLKKLDYLPIEIKEWRLKKIDDIKLGDLERGELLTSTPSLKFDVFNREVKVNLGCDKEIMRNFKMGNQSIFIEPVTIFTRPSNCDKKWSIPFLEDITGELYFEIDDLILRIKNSKGVTYEFE